MRPHHRAAPAALPFLVPAVLSAQSAPPLRQAWQSFSRPSRTFSLGFLTLGGFNTALEATNTEAFCIGCHEMQANPYERGSRPSTSLTGPACLHRLPQGHRPPPARHAGRAAGLERDVRQSAEAERALAGEWGRGGEVASSPAP